MVNMNKPRTRNGTNRGRSVMDTMNGGKTVSQEFKARLFLFIACLWPLWVMALFGASASSHNHQAGNGKDTKDNKNVNNNRLNLRSVLDRVDIMGYGPTHPRVAVVVVGEDSDSIISSVESVFSHTDLNRIFVIVAILDGEDQADEASTTRKKLKDSLMKMDEGSVPHWHGLRPDIHFGGEEAKHQEDEEPHGRKMHVMFHSRREGVSSSRMEAVEFIQLLEEKHEQAGLKSPQEDLILLLLQAGCQLMDRKWLGPVTSALIVPPPLLGLEDEGIAMKLANAVSLRSEGPGKRTSFNEKLAPNTLSEPTATDVNLSSGQSYPTPALNGAAIAMRLDTFVNLPAQDTSLMEPWPANLELALNLWLCADGIDIVQDAQVSVKEEHQQDILPPVPLEPEMAARFAAVWMEERTQQKFFQAYSTTITRLDWETKVQRARQVPTFPKDIVKKCRTFEWYIQEINNDLSKVLEQVGWEEQPPQPPPPPPPADNGNNVNKALQQQQKEEEKLPAKQAEDQPKQEAPPTEKKHEEHDEKPKEDKQEEHKEAPEEEKHEEHHEPPPNVEKQEEHHEPPKEENQDKQPVVEAHKELLKVDEAAVAEDVIPNLAQRHKQKPKIPLRQENLEIVQKAKPISLEFVDVADGHGEHPHMGAKDENGNWGYVHDETALHNNPPPLTWEDGQERQSCIMRDNNYRMLTERVFVDKEYDEKQNESVAKRDKIFCLVYTIESGHPKIPFIRETWGPKCDGFMVGSTKTDPSLGTVEIPHEGPEEYNNIWQKVRSMWSYIYDNYYEKYDWFHIGGDDLFLIIENLRYYLESEEIRTAANGGIYLPDGTETTQTPLLLGRRFAYMGDMNDIFDSGGSGYTMNKAALKTLVVEGFPNYFPHAHTFSEDTMVAKIFRKFGVFPYDTKDDDGGERYMPFMPGHHWGYRLPPDPEKDWYAKYSINIKFGAEHCSPRSVAFHYVKGVEMKRFFALAYKLCPKEYANI